MSSWTEYDWKLEAKVSVVLKRVDPNLWALCCLCTEMNNLFYHCCGFTSVNNFDPLCHFSQIYKPGGTVHCGSQDLVYLCPPCACSVAVPPYTLYLSLTATPLFLLVAVAIDLEYNAAHGSLWGSARLLTSCRSLAESVDIVVACLS